VNGYTDNLGSAAYGRTLSLRRAEAVAAALRPRLSGVPVTLQPRGFGEADPVASNATEAGRQLNRRVTIELPR
jgi:outer membrane protein OmpA-like peptidoglycan-associated protein